MPVAKVEAPVMVCEDSVELPVAVDNVPDAEAVLEPEWEAVEEEEVLEEPPHVPRLTDAERAIQQHRSDAQSATNG